MTSASKNRPFTSPASPLEPGSGTFAKALVDWGAAPAPCWRVAYPGGRKLITYRVDVLRLRIDPITQKQSLTTPHEIVVPDAGLLFGDDGEGQSESFNSDLPRSLGASLVVVYRDRTKPFSGSFCTTARTPNVPTPEWTDRSRGPTKHHL